MREAGSVGPRPPRSHHFRPFSPFLAVSSPRRLPSLPAAAAAAQCPSFLFSGTVPALLPLPALPRTCGPCPFYPLFPPHSCLAAFLLPTIFPTHSRRGNDEAAVNRTWVPRTASLPRLPLPHTRPFLPTSLPLPSLLPIPLSHPSLITSFSPPPSISSFLIPTADSRVL